MGIPMGEKVYSRMEMKHYKQYIHTNKKLSKVIANVIIYENE